MTWITRTALTLALASLFVPAVFATEAEPPQTRQQTADPNETADPNAANPRDERPTPAKDAARPPADGFVLQSESGDYKLRVGGYLQGDGRFYLADETKLGTDGFLLRRARPQLQGTLAKRFDFYLMTDFGGGTAVVQDAYLDARFFSFLRVRAGKFKAPVGLERLQSGSNLLFVERALPTAIAPNRDVGLQLHGELAAGILSFALAVQNGVADGGSGDGDANDGKDVSGRLFLQPFRKGEGPLRGLGLGISGQTGKQESAQPASYKSPGQLTFFSYAKGVAVDGTRTRLSPQGFFYLGPFGMIGEYAVSSSPLLKQAEAGDVRVRVRNEAWQLAASLLVTGEKAGFAAVRPEKPFDPKRGAWGALELAARVHELAVAPVAFEQGFASPAKSARKATAWAVGLNWVLNRNVKYVIDYEQTRFDGGAEDGDRPTEHALFIRAQVLF